MGSGGEFAGTGRKSLEDMLQLNNSALVSLLTYADRFYTRQFLTRKPKYTTLLAKFEKYLDDLIHTGFTPSEYRSKLN